MAERKQSKASGHLNGYWPQNQFPEARFGNIKWQAQASNETTDSETETGGSEADREKLEYLRNRFNSADGNRTCRP